MIDNHTQRLSDSIRQKASQCNMLVLDVDGVLSDGRLTFDNAGMEIKSFNVKDGLGIKLLQKISVQVAIITGRTSHIVEHRAKSLGITEIIQGREDKGSALMGLCKSLNLPLAHCAYMGDDWPDLSAMQQVGLAVAPANAHPEVLARVDFITHAAGGDGAVRELCDVILTAKDAYDDALASFLTQTGHQW